MLTPVSGLLNSAHSTGESKGADDSRKLEQVAAEFESLLMAHLLRTVREASGGGWLGDGADQAGTTMIDMAEQQLAGVIASQGGLGLREVIVRGLGGGDASQTIPDLDDKNSE